MTYSIAALDRDSGELGVAVQTCGPGVGAAVPWVEPGVGAVATQSFTNVNLGVEGLARLRAGVAAAEALREIVARDAGRDVRQVGLVDAAGRSAAYTGSACVAEAGHVVAPGVSVQANMMQRAAVPAAMLDAFRHAEGDLAERLVAALRAAEREGGDVRGSQSAALLVAPGTPEAQPWARRYDLRVDSAHAPLDELERLLRLARAYEALDTAMGALAGGEVELVLASTTFAHRLAPEDAQLTYWHAMALLAIGRSDEARPLLDAALRSEPRLAEFGRRFAAAGHGGQLAEALEGRSARAGGEDARDGRSD